MRRSVLINGAWAAGKDYPLRFEVAYDPNFRIERMDFTIDPQLADSPRYQLGILRAEIENQNGLERNGHEIAPFLVSDFWLSKLSCDKSRVYVSRELASIRSQARTCEARKNGHQLDFNGSRIGALIRPCQRAAETA